MVAWQQRLSALDFVANFLVAPGNLEGCVVTSPVRTGHGSCMPDEGSAAKYSVWHLQVRLVELLQVQPGSAAKGGRIPEHHQSVQIAKAPIETQNA